VHEEVVGVGSASRRVEAEDNGGAIGAPVAVAKPGYLERERLLQDDDTALLDRDGRRLEREVGDLRCPVARLGRG
jgi:hypothetical protein